MIFADWGVVQLVGHLTVNEDGVGSSPTAPAKFFETRARGEHFVHLYGSAGEGDVFDMKIEAATPEEAKNLALANFRAGLYKDEGMGGWRISRCGRRFSAWCRSRFGNFVEIEARRKFCASLLW